MASIGIRRNGWQPFNVKPEAGCRYIVCMGRLNKFGQLENYSKCFPDGQWKEATDEAWTCHDRRFRHMVMIDLKENLPRESAHVLNADGSSWYWDYDTDYDLRNYLAVCAMRASSSVRHAVAYGKTTVPGMTSLRASARTFR